MFSAAERDSVRDWLMDRARSDERISSAALTGSGATGDEDQWSDVDVFFGVAHAFAVDDVLTDWSALVYAELGAVHHFDLVASPAIYRAFLLASCLEVDLGFVTAADYGARGPCFGPVFGPGAKRCRRRRSIRAI